MLCMSYQILFLTLDLCLYLLVVHLELERKKKEAPKETIHVPYTCALELIILSTGNM